jgi:hypothetical protein
MISDALIIICDYCVADATMACSLPAAANPFTARPDIAELQPSVGMFDDMAAIARASLERELFRRFCQTRQAALLLLKNADLAVQPATTQREQRGVRVERASGAPQAQRNRAVQQKRGGSASELEQTAAHVAAAAACLTVAGALVSLLLAAWRWFVEHRLSPRYAIRYDMCYAMRCHARFVEHRLSVGRAALRGRIDARRSSGVATPDDRCAKRGHGHAHCTA